MKPERIDLEQARRAGGLRIVTLAHIPSGENGIGWTERLRGVHEAVTKPGGDPAGISAYLGKKYGYTRKSADARRVESQRV